MPETRIATLRNGFSCLSATTRPLLRVPVVKVANAAWMPIVFVDTPVSVLLLPLAWRFDYPISGWKS